MSELLPRAATVLPAGSWDVATARDSVSLGFDDRFRRRRTYAAEGGLIFLLDLPEAMVLHDGDGLALEDGGVVRVRAAAEPLVEVTATSPEHLARLAWHLGNRHLPVQIGGASILIREDHVIVAMLRGLGAGLRHVDAPFDPEGGAYGEHNRQPGHPHAHHHHGGHGHHHHD